MEKKTQAFVYKWTELSTGKWYIGSHASKGCHPNDRYICSSKLVKTLIRENPANWNRTILLMVDPIDALPYETQVLIGLDAKHDPMCYNLHNGNGKWSFVGKVGNRKGKEPWNKGLTKETSLIVARSAKLESIAKTGCISLNKGRKFGPQSPAVVEKRAALLRGKTRPKEVCEKISVTKKANNLTKQKQTWEEIYGLERAISRREKLKNRKRDVIGVFVKEQ